MWKLLLGPIVEGVSGWAERKQALRGKKLEQIQTMDLAKLEDRKDSWKDEFITIVILIPAILAFIPGMGTYVEQGFAVLTTTPEWYQWIFMAVVSAGIGVEQVYKGFKKVKK